MHLKIVGKEHLVFEGDVFGIKTRAIDGAVTCLDEHADFLTILRKGQIEILEKEENPKNRIITLGEESILFIENNRAIIFS